MKRMLLTILMGVILLGCAEMEYVRWLSRLREGAPDGLCGLREGEGRVLCCTDGQGLAYGTSEDLAEALDALTAREAAARIRSANIAVNTEPGRAGL